MLTELFKAVAALVAVVVGLTLVGFVQQYLYERKARRNGCGLPEQRICFPFGLRNIGDIRASSESSEGLERVSKDFINYPIIRANGPGTKIVHISDPELCKVVLKTKFNEFGLGYRGGSFYPVVGRGIFTSEGQEWKHSRQLLRPQFSRNQLVPLESARAHLNILFDRHLTKSDFVECQALFNDWTLDTSCEFLLGESPGCLTNPDVVVQGPHGPVTAGEFNRAFSDLRDPVTRRFALGRLYWLWYPLSFHRNIKTCQNYVEFFVNRIMTTPEEKDNGKYSVIREMSKLTKDAKYIRDQVFHILSAGRTTTASLMTFLVFFLAQDQERWDLLREEVLNKFGHQDSDDLSFEAVKSLEYANACIKEALRMFPIVPRNARVPAKDVILPHGGGKNFDEPVLVEKDSLILLWIHGIHHDPRIWGEDEDKFRPERWFEGDKRHDYAYMPFGGGPRICLGQQYATVETILFLIRLCQTYERIELEPDQNFSRAQAASSHFQHGLRARFHPAQY